MSCVVGAGGALGVQVSEGEVVGGRTPPAPTPTAALHSGIKGVISNHSLLLVPGTRMFCNASSTIIPVKKVVFLYEHANQNLR